MKNYLLCLALAWMPFIYASGTVQAQQKPLHIEQPNTLEVSGKGKVIINFIPSTEQSSIEVFRQKDGKKVKVTTAKEMKRLISITEVKSITEKKIISKEKIISNNLAILIYPHQEDQVIVHINIPSFSFNNIKVSHQIRLEIKDGPFSEKGGTIVPYLHILCVGDSHISFSKIRIESIDIKMRDNATLSGTNLEATDSIFIISISNSKIKIKNIDTINFDFIGQENSQTWLGGKVKHGSISLSSKSILAAPQLDIEEGEIKMEDGSRASLSIKNFVKKSIGFFTVFINYASRNAF